MYAFPSGGSRALTAVVGADACGRDGAHPSMGQDGYVPPLEGHGLSWPPLVLLPSTFDYAVPLHGEDHFYSRSVRQDYQVDSKRRRISPTMRTPRPTLVRKAYEQNPEYFGMAYLEFLNPLFESTWFTRLVQELMLKHFVGIHGRCRNDRHSLPVPL